MSASNTTGCSGDWISISSVEGFSHGAVVAPGPSGSGSGAWTCTDHGSICGTSGSAGASAGAVELTGSNFDAEVKNSGKNAFVKFLAPW